MKKKYLNGIEEILAYKDTNIKIYRELPDYKEKEAVNYYTFINGILCWFEEEQNAWTIGASIFNSDKFYVWEEGEEPMQEATEEDVGKLCRFFNEAKDGVDIRKPFVAILWRIDNDFKYPFVDDATGSHWEHCRRLSPAEVAEITGYKVEEE